MSDLEHGTTSSRALRASAASALKAAMKADRVALHSLSPEDARAVAAIRAMSLPRKGVILGPEARPMFDAARSATPAAEGVALEAATVGDIPGVWCRPRNAVPGARLMFLHGGGYMMGSAQAMTSFAGQIAIRAQAETFVVDYRLAPENPFPAAFDDVLTAYRALATEHAGAIAITGESAGGGLALAVLPAVKNELALLQPCAVAVMSPWTDLTLSGSSYASRADADPIFTRDALAALAGKVLQGQIAANSRASPLFSEMGGLPPLWIDVGEDEVLLDDARRYAEQAEAAGVDVQLSGWEGMPHVFQAQVGKLAAAERSLEAAGLFLRERLQDGLAKQLKLYPQRR